MGSLLQLIAMLMTTSVMQELTCMDAGREIGANQMICHVQFHVRTQCHQYVMKKPILATRDGTTMDAGREISVTLLKNIAQLMLPGLQITIIMDKKNISKNK